MAIYLADRPTLARIDLDASAAVVGTDVRSAPSLTSSTGISLATTPASGPPTGRTVAPDTAEEFTRTP